MAEGQPRLAPELTRIADNLVLDTKTDEVVQPSPIGLRETILICTYSQTSLVCTPGDPPWPNCYSLSVVLANHID